MRRLGHAMLVPAFLLAACGATPTTQPPPNLGLANDTTVSVTLAVNGVQVSDIAPGGVEPSMDRAALPPLPWTVTIRSSSGQVLGTMFAGTSPADGTFSATFGELACGQVTVWVGAAQPSGLAGPPSEASPGSSLIPCGP